MGNQDEIEGFIAYFGLKEWWLSSFSKDERKHIDSKFKPMGLGGITLTRGKNFSTNQSATQFLNGLASWFNNNKDISIAECIHRKLSELAKENPVVAPGYFEGRHFTTYVSDIDRLKKNNQVSEMEELLVNAVKATEDESKFDGGGVAPHYYNELAIMYRKQKNYVKEVAILERFANQKHAPGVMPAKLLERLKKTKELLEKHSDKTS